MSGSTLSGAGEGAVLLADFPGPCFSVSADGVVSVGNAAAEVIAREEFAGRTVNAVVTEQLDALTAGRRNAWSHDREFVVHTAHESSPRVFIPQFFKLGAGWAVLFSDATDLCNARRSTTRAFSLLGHEMKTPITSIRMALHLLLEEKLGGLTPEQRELVEASRDDCESMLHLVQQINEVFVIESGQDAMVKTLVEPSKLVAGPLAEQQTLFERNAQQVVVQTPSEELQRVFVDAAKTERAIGELLKNAALVGVPGGKVSISISNQKGWVRIEVGYAVTSEGSAAGRKKGVEPFEFRKGPGGCDFGLAICKAIVTALDGRTGFKTAEGFEDLYLEFPAARRP